MKAQLCFICLTIPLTNYIPSLASAQDIVEVLKDAQVTNRDSWKRGRSAFRLEITNNQKPGVALMDGDLRWDNTDMIIKYKVVDPEGVRHRDRGRTLDMEWNYVARNSKKVITYAARHNVLNERRADPNAFEPIYDLSLLTAFAQGGQQTGDEGRPWSELIGPSPSMPEVFNTSKFSHEMLPNGDCVQTRIDDDGHKFVIVFASQYNFAVRSTVEYDASGTKGDEDQYDYSKSNSGQIIPKSVIAVSRSDDLKKMVTFRYTFSDVQLPGDVSPNDFSRDAILARIDRETDHKKRSQPKEKLVVDDASLDAQAKLLRESGSARPKP